MPIAFRFEWEVRLREEKRVLKAPFDTGGGFKPSSSPMTFFQPFEQPARDWLLDPYMDSDPSKDRMPLETVQIQAMGCKGMDNPPCPLG